MNVISTDTSTIHLFRPGAEPQQAQLALEAAGEGGYWVVLRLCRVGSEWQTLRKNAAPLSLADALRLLERMLALKLDDGFLGASSPVPDPDIAPGGLTPSQFAALAARIAPDNWRLLSARQRSRTAWRLGELRVAAAVPAMVELLGTGDSMLDYCLAWAIGRCGDAGAKIAMAELAQRGRTDAVKRIARLAWLQLAVDEERAAHAASLITDWPAPLRDAWQAGNTAQLDALLADPQTWQRFAYADWLEQLDQIAQAQPSARDLLLREAGKVAFVASTFRAVRRLYKAAEFRGDGELWSLLQRRLENTPPTFRRLYEKQRAYLNGKRVLVSEELTRSDSRLAYSQRTREYLLRRSWRSLRRLGEAGSVEFGPLAFAALVGYDDATAQAAHELSIGYWENGYKVRREYRHRHYRATLFNRLLFRPGGPLRSSRHGVLWSSDKPLQPEREQRFEPFAGYWNQRPDLLLRLALEARAEQVQSFAVRALADLPAYCARFDDAIWRRLLNSPFAPTAAFAHRQLQARIAAEPDRTRRESWLALLLGSRHASVYNAALLLLEDDPASHAGSPALITAVLTARTQEIRRQSRLLCQAALATPGVAEAVLQRLIDWLEDADPFTEALDASTANLAWIIANPFRAAAAQVDYARLLALLAHPAIAVRCLAVDWLIVHRQPVSELPISTYRSLLDSDDERLLAASMRLLGALPDAVLATQAELVARFLLCPSPQVRQAVQPLAVRLAAIDAGFVAGLMPKLLDAMFRSETVEGLHDEVLALLTEPMAAASRALPIDTMLHLLEARCRAAQRFGTWLLAGHADADLPLADWARLARHETLTIRTRALTILDSQFAQLGINGLLPVLDSRWADSRSTVLGWLRERIALADWSMAQLIALCDHQHSDVQKLGCELMGKRLMQDSDTASLLALAQHPSLKVQRFVADFLRHSLGEDVAALARLRPYFLTVLAQVNRGRAAKTAVLAYLQARAAASESAASEVASLFAHLAVTVAITDRAQYVAGLYDIRRRYPAIASGLAVHAPAVRGVA